MAARSAMWEGPSAAHHPGSPERRPRSRRTRSRVPGPAHGTMGTPVSLARRISWERSSRRRRQARPAAWGDSGGLGNHGLEQGGVDIAGPSSAAACRRRRRRCPGARAPRRARGRRGDRRGQDDDQGAGGNPSAQLGAQPLLVGDRPVGRAGPGQGVQNPAEVVLARCGAAREVGHRGRAGPRGRRCAGSAGRWPPAARTALSRLLLRPPALAGADVVHRVDEQEDLAVLVGVGRGDVELTGADADRPVDASQAVAEAEGTDVGELAAVARGGRVLADEAVRAGHRDPGIEVVRQRHGGDRRGRHHVGRPAVGAERAGHAEHGGPVPPAPAHAPAPHRQADRLRPQCRGATARECGSYSVNTSGISTSPRSSTPPHRRTSATQRVACPSRSVRCRGPAATTGSARPGSACPTARRAACRARALRAAQQHPERHQPEPGESGTGVGGVGRQEARTGASSSVGAAARPARAHGRA